MTEPVPFSAIEIKITTGDHVRTILATLSTDVRFKTDRHLDPDVHIHAGGGAVYGRFTGDQMEVELTFTAFNDPATDAIIQERIQP